MKAMHTPASSLSQPGPVAHTGAHTDAPAWRAEALTPLLHACRALHDHICPRQVLGMRMSLWAASLLALDLPQTDKRLLTIVETDGCFSDGVAVAANCWVGRRTMRVEDFGKVAATYIDTHTDRAWRIYPHPAARQTAVDQAATYAPEATNRWEAMLYGYQRMPTAALLCAQPVTLTTPSRVHISIAGQRAQCGQCGEEILNEREIVHNGVVRCRACAGAAYYQIVTDSPSPESNPDA
ncbi:MAG: FmdE family protein [Litorilinea sp.]